MILLLINGCQTLNCSARISIDSNGEKIEDIQLEYLQPGIKCKF